MSKILFLLLVMIKSINHKKYIYTLPINEMFLKTNTNVVRAWKNERMLIFYTKKYLKSSTFFSPAIRLDNKMVTTALLKDKIILTACIKCNSRTSKY